MRRILPVLALAVVAGLAAPTAAHAVLMRVDFTVLADPADPVRMGQTASGYFTFESTIVTDVFGGGGTLINANGLGALSAFSFTWDGHTWSTLDADAMVLALDPYGQCTGWAIGGAPQGYNGITSNIYPDFYAISASGYNFVYSAAPTPSGGFYYGSVTSWSAGPAPVPEPGTLSLLALGLLPLGLIRRRKS